LFSITYWYWVEGRQKRTSGTTTATAVIIIIILIIIIIIIIIMGEWNGYEDIAIKIVHAIYCRNSKQVTTAVRRLSRIRGVLGLEL
jgi:hypothetical protein